MYEQLLNQKLETQLLIMVFGHKFSIHFENKEKKNVKKKIHKNIKKKKKKRMMRPFFSQTFGVSYVWATNFHLL